MMRTLYSSADGVLRIQLYFVTLSISVAKREESAPFVSSQERFLIVKKFMRTVPMNFNIARLCFNPSNAMYELLAFFGGIDAI